MSSEESLPEFLTGSRPRLATAGAGAARPRSSIPSAGSVKRAAIAGRVLLPSTDLAALAGAALLTGTGWAAAVYSLAALLAIAWSGLHRLRISLRLADQVPRIALAAIVPALLLAPWAGAGGRLVLQAVVAVALLTLARGGCYACLRAARRRGLVVQPALIVGTGPLAVQVARTLTEHPELGLRPVGFLGTAASTDHELTVLGSAGDFAAVVSCYRSCCVIVGPDADTDADLVSVLRAGSLAAAVYLIPRLYEVAALLPPGFLDEVWGIPLVRLRTRGVWSDRLAKRAFDVIVGSVLLVLLAPLLIVVVVAAWLRGGRPVLFRQNRLTRDGKVISITKVRTVTSASPDTQWAPEASKSWLRATHLDELPQLVQVIRGDMSLVGPRPERPFFAVQFTSQIPGYDDRHRVRGGMTGWAQVHGLTGDTSISDRARFDNYYIDHWSVWLDVVILIRTLVSPFAGLRRQRTAARQRAADAGAESE
jgi:lipopolysaccharide/colanic/teichoic acid biosynthesis glycosyltransferase